LDVAPGSILEFEAPEEKFTGELLGQTRPSRYYGLVNRVTLNLDAEGQRASTGFQLAFVRDEAENRDDDTSCAEHPIWAVPLSRRIFGAGAWNGAPLVDDPLFGTPPTRFDD
jgi:hypothetical protein